MLFISTIKLNIFSSELVLCLMMSMPTACICRLHLQMVQEIGNSRARAVYEANVPDHFRRPQSDSGLEAFIRSKYETKKYIAREWVPPKPKIPQVH